MTTIALVVGGVSPYVEGFYDAAGRIPNGAGAFFTLRPEFQAALDSATPDPVVLAQLRDRGIYPVVDEEQNTPENFVAEQQVTIGLEVVTRGWSYRPMTQEELNEQSDRLARLADRDALKTADSLLQQIMDDNGEPQSVRTLANTLRRVMRVAELDK